MIRKILPWFVFVSLILLIIVGLASKDKLTQYLSNTMMKNAAPSILDSGAAYIDSAYNYSKNGLEYEMTFLEFGATGCVACRKMESVMGRSKT
jgi:thioredoxin 1